MGSDWDDDFDDRQGILLESGTNEVEILEFFMRGQSFGVNVAKVIQILPFDPSRVTPLPGGAGSNVIGVYLWREGTVSFIDLNGALHRPPADEKKSDKPLVLITEYNNVVTSFLIDGVNRIHRVSWQVIRPMDSFFGNYSSRLTGTLRVDETDILIVDFEHLLAEICPETSLVNRLGDVDLTKDRIGREGIRLMIVEDSSFIREMMQQILIDAGYKSLQVFENGEKAFQHIETIFKEAKAEGVKFESKLQLLITDIEMPRMDGLTLCRKVKEELGLVSLPVIVFSSLVSEQMIHKCKDVGADETVTKPEMGRLVAIVDELCLKLVAGHAPAKQKM